MLITNQTGNDYWFGPLHIPAGVGQTLTVDDTSATSLYLTDDSVADAINTLYNSGKITVSSAASPFPRATGNPEVLHGDGSPEGLVYAGQGSVFLRRDAGSAVNCLYTKTTGVHFNTGWVALNVVNQAITMVRRAANQGASSAWADMNFDTEVVDDLSAWSSGVANKLLLGSGGRFEINYNQFVTGQTGAGSSTVQILRYNSSDVLQETIAMTETATMNGQISLTGYCIASSGDYLKIQQNTGATGAAGNLTGTATLIKIG